MNILFGVKRMERYWISRNYIQKSNGAEERQVKKIKEMLKKWKVQLIMLAVIVVLTIFSAVMIKKVIVLSNKLDEIINEQMQVDSVREELQAISEYAAYQFNYTSILDFKDDIKWKGIKIPFTYTEYIATIDGFMNIGIKADKTDIQEEKDSEGKVKKVIIKIPHSEILKNATDSNTLKEYDYDKNIFNPLKPGEYNQLRVKAEEKEKKKVLKSGILEKSDERIENLLLTHFQPLYGEDVKIEVQFIE